MRLLMYLIGYAMAQGRPQIGSPLHSRDSKVSTSLCSAQPDVEATAASLAADGVVHGPITRVQRPAGPASETEPVRIDFVEIDDQPGLSSGRQVGSRRGLAGRFAAADGKSDASQWSGGTDRVGALRTRC
jgi:hypothetical protein